MSAAAFTAEPLPHCAQVGLRDERRLLDLLTRREAYDLAAQLIRSADAIRPGTSQTGNPPAVGTSRFDQEFGTALSQATIIGAKP